MTSVGRKRIAVIGAGVSGLCSVKSCLESGVTPVCFEQSSDIGGLWRYKTDPLLPGEGSVMKCTSINTSKEIMAFSDFPPPAHMHTFMHHSEVFQYLRLYADHFNLLPHIKLNHQIKRIERSENYDANGTWMVSFVDLKTSPEVVRQELFDGILLCSGHHTYPHIPKHPGREHFKGEIMHAQSYRTCAGYEDKTVVVIGMGNSAGDIAVELGHSIAQKVYLSVRRNTWVYPRIVCAVPYDMMIFSRPFFYIHKLIPRIVSYYIEKELTRMFDYKSHHILPNHPPFSAHPTVNNSLMEYMISGAIIRKPTISKFTENGVIFSDGSEAENVDVVIYGTGYTLDFPFLEEGVMTINENDVDLYKYIYPPHLKHRTLGVIGMIQPYGAIQSIAEMQTRLFTRVFIDEATLPDEKEMVADIAEVRSALRKRYVSSRRHTFQVDGVPYMDSLAEMIGVRPPSPLKLLQNGDWILFSKLYWFEGAYSYHYRLNGPHSWSGARDAILYAKSRSITPVTGLPEEEQVEFSVSLSKFLDFWTRLLYGQLLNTLLAMGLVAWLFFHGITFLLDLFN